MGDNWTRGSVGQYTFTAKVYDADSCYGIEGGRVSKLTIRNPDGYIVVNYDRGWDIEPESAADRLIYDTVLKLLSNKKAPNGATNTNKG